MGGPLLGEFMGTLVLVLIGNGTVANVVLRRTLGEGAGWMVICTGFALGVTAGVTTAIAFGSQGAHINPAVTLALGLASGDLGQFVPYAAAQTAGAMVGAALVYLNFLPHWRETADQGKTLACFATAPAIRRRGANVLSEAIGTCLLVLCVAAIFSRNATAGGPIPAGLGPFLVGAVVWAIGLGLGGATGFAINPARDFGPRLIHMMLPIPGKGSSDWAYGVVPIAGGLAGGAIAGLLVRISQV